MNFLTTSLTLSFLACSSVIIDKGINPPDKGSFDEYWNAGEAEISSFELKQDLYGEIHSGKAVLVFVTEAFSKSSNAKADNPAKDDVSVLKLNYSKKLSPFYETDEYWKLYSCSYISRVKNIDVFPNPIFGNQFSIIKLNEKLKKI